MKKKNNNEDEKKITPENFTPIKTLGKLQTNWETYLLEIFKTRLFPPNSDDIYEKSSRISLKNTTLKLFLNL